MEVVIYIDVLFLTNFLVDFSLLMATSIFTRRAYKFYRMFISSVVSSILYCLCYVFLSNAICNILAFPLSLLIIYICFDFSDFKGYLKLYINFLFISFIFFGSCYLLFTFTSYSNVLYLNGSILYLDINLVFLFLFCIFAIITSILISAAYKHINTSGESYQLKIYHNKKISVIPCFLDTGNSLCDIISGLPVIIIEFKSIKQLLDIELNEFIKVKDFEISSVNGIKFRYLPYSGVWSCNSLLPVIRVDTIYVNNKKIDALIGITTTSLSTFGEYSALLNPLIFS